MTEQSEYQYDVFISYSHTDKEWVWGWLVPRLKKAGLAVCTDRESFDVGVPSLVNMENAVAVTPDGRHAISASSDRTLKVWDLGNGQELATVTLEGALRCIALAPDGVTILAGDGAGNVYCLRYMEGDKVTK